MDIESLLSPYVEPIDLVSDAQMIVASLAVVAMFPAVLILGVALGRFRLEYLRTFAHALINLAAFAIAAYTVIRFAKWVIP